jgi:GT2 family glycosyltransferase
VIIPSYSRPDLLARCLASLRRNAPLSTEIIVVAGWYRNLVDLALLAEGSKVQDLGGFMKRVQEAVLKGL